MPLPEHVVEQIAARFTRPDFEEWQAIVDSIAGCSNPIRVTGSIRLATGGVIYDTNAEPDKVMYIRCGNRRRSVCPSCSFLYKGDQFLLARAGMIGGDNVPASVSEHPQQWVTLTAPGFGAVHTIKDGPCHPAGAPGGKSGRTKGATCPHGLPAFCLRRHKADDPQVTQPLCRACYDYRAAVLFNWHSGELWRRFRIALERDLADELGYTEEALKKLVRFEYFKVAELQARGVVHFHAVIRLDRAGCEPGDYQPPPIDVPAAAFERAVIAAARQVRKTVPTGDGELALRFGTQVDVQPISVNELRGKTPEAMAAYLAKYTTKCSEDFGIGNRPITSFEARRRKASPHVVAMIEAAEHLARVVRTDEATRIRGMERALRVTHQFGYRGHFATRSRRYSFTLGYLQGKRRSYCRAKARERQLEVEELGPDEVVDLDEVETISEFVFAGMGWLSEGDAALAASSAARAREWHIHQADQRREARAAA